MSWVDIEQGNNKFRVPYNAFKTIFEKQGFVIVSSTKKSKPTQKPIIEEKPKEVSENGEQQNGATNKRQPKKPV